jgi:hypothetical protein
MRPSCGVILCDLVAEKKLNLGYDKKGKEGAGKAKSFKREGRKWKKGGLPCGLCKTHGRHVFAVCFRSSHGKQVSGKKIAADGKLEGSGKYRNPNDCRVPNLSRVFFSLFAVTLFLPCVFLF